MQVSTCPHTDSQRNTGWKGLATRAKLYMGSEWCNYTSAWNESKPWWFHSLPHTSPKDSLPQGAEGKVSNGSVVQYSFEHSAKPPLASSQSLQ